MTKIKMTEKNGVKKTPIQCNKHEGLGGWDGWEEVEGLEDSIGRIEDLAYELRSCIRGAKTRCKDWEALACYIKALASDLDDAAEVMSSKTDEALTPALQQRAKLKDLAKYLETLYFFNDVYGETLDTIKKDGILYNVGDSKDDNVNVAKEITADFADYCNWEVRHDADDDVWYMAITFKPELWELGLEDLKEVFGLLNDAFMPYC